MADLSGLAGCGEIQFGLLSAGHGRVRARSVAGRFLIARNRSCLKARTAHQTVQPKRKNRHTILIESNGSAPARSVPVNNPSENAPKSAPQTAVRRGIDSPFEAICSNMFVTNIAAYDKLRCGSTEFSASVSCELIADS
jgi:hypothetical protein